MIFKNKTLFMIFFIILKFSIVVGSEIKFLIEKNNFVTLNLLYIFFFRFFEEIKKGFFEEIKKGLVEPPKHH